MSGRPPLRTWVPWLVLFSWGLLTVGGTAYVAATVRTRDELRFLSAAQDIRSSLLARIETYVALLRAGSALFALSERVGREDFEQFVAHLQLRDRFPGVQGIGYAARFPASEIPRVEAAMRRQGSAGFSVWPTDPPRDIYTAILYLEPLDARNEVAVGYDMYSNPVRREAMRRAQDTGRPVASGRVKLVQENDPATLQAGFLIYLPVYRGASVPVTTSARAEAIQGFVYSPFRAGDFLNAVLQPEEQRLLMVRVYDGPTAEPDALLFESAGEGGTEARALRSFTGLEIAGRQWAIEIVARPEFGGTSPALVPGIFTMGLAIGGLLFLLTRAEGRAREAAEAAAEKLRRSEEELQIAGRAKDEFLATLSHELRTPLNAILGWTSMLRMGHLTDDRQRKALEIIERNARTQVQLIEDLLDVSRIITGKLRLDLRTIPVNPALEEALNTVRPAADAKAVTLAWEPDPAAGNLYAAPDRLQQIVWNLLSNAIKFTPPGGRVELRTVRTDGEMRLIVSDTGAGIHPAFLPHVFERFRQADSTTTRTHSGMGLGLAIVRHLVELHGGTIEAASDGVDRGATFTVRFPVQPRPRGAATSDGAGERAAAGAATPLGGVRVLVVDDEPDARQLAEAALVSHGARVDTAMSAEQAWSLLDREPVDVVVTDLAMPGEDGYDLLRRVRALGGPHLQRVPVIAMTAYARDSDRDRALAEGFQAFLPKPIDLQELARTVAHVARQSRSG